MSASRSFLEAVDRLERGIARLEGMVLETRADADLPEPLGDGTGTDVYLDNLSRHLMAARNELTTLRTVSRFQSSVAAQVRRGTFARRR